MVSASLRAMIPLLLICLGLAVPFGASADADSACRVLQPSELRFTSAHLTGVLDAPHDVACYDLPDPAGTVYELNNLLDGSHGRMIDATGAIACTPTTARKCALTGTAPFRLEVVSTAGESTAYEVQVFRLTGDTGCPSAQPIRFDGTGDVVRGQLRQYEVLCRSYELDPGVLRIEDSPGSWQVVDPAGAAACPEPELLNPVCDIEAGGTVTLVVKNYAHQAGGSLVEKVVVELGSTGGCRPPIGTDWTAPTAHQVMEHPHQYDCRYFTAQPGDRVVSAARTGVYTPVADTLLVDAHGTRVCVTVPRTLGCTLTGEPPYRLITWVVGGPADYDIALRSLEADSGCPHQPTARFGVAPTPSHRTIGCRTFESEQGRAWYVVSQMLHPDVGAPVFFHLYRPDYTGQCATFIVPTCHIEQAGRQVFVTSLFATQQLNAVYDPAGGAGCGIQRPNLEPRTGKLALGQLDCVTFNGTPGTVVGLAQLHQYDGSLVPLAVFNRDGRQICLNADDRAVASCHLDGPGPYRAVVGDGRTAAYRTALLDLADQPGCTQRIRFGTRGSLVELPAGSVAVCVRATSWQGQGEQISFKRTDGSGKAALTCVQPSGATGTTYGRHTSARTQCHRHPGDQGYSIVIVGNGQPMTLRVRRQPLA